jgi:hypothetical protein
MGYPCYRHNREGQSVFVENEADDRALKGEWFDHLNVQQDERDERFADDQDVDRMLDEEDDIEDTKKKKKHAKK